MTCFRAAERETAVAVAASETHETAVAASQTDKVDVTVGEQLLKVGFVEMTYQFLSHMMDIKRGNLTDKLATKGVLSVDERQALKRQKKTDAKVNALLTMLKKKTADEFESFLAALSETGQDAVADVVRLATDTVAQTGHSPLHTVYGTFMLLL